MQHKFRAIIMTCWVSCFGIGPAVYLFRVEMLEDGEGGGVEVEGCIRANRAYFAPLQVCFHRELLLPHGRAINRRNLGAMCRSNEQEPSSAAAIGKGYR